MILDWVLLYNKFDKILLYIIKNGKNQNISNRNIFIDAADPPPPQGWGYKKKYSSATIYVGFSDGPANCANGLSVHLGE